MSNEQYYKSLISNKEEPTFLADLDGDILLINQRGEELSGYSEEEITLFSVRDIFITLKNKKNPFNISQIREFSSTIYLIDAFHYLIPVFLDFKEIEGSKFLCTIKPESSKQKTEKPDYTAKPEQSNPAKIILPAQDEKNTRQFDEKFEHDVRSSLNTILGFTTILSKEASIVKDNKLNKYIDSILKNGNNLKKLFDKLDSSSSDNYKVSNARCSIGPILQKAQIMLQSTAKENNVEIEINQSEEYSIITDEDLLSDIISFLIKKAILYTRNDDVKINVSADEQSEKLILKIDNLGQDIPQGIIHFIKRENNKDYYDYNNLIVSSNPEMSSLLRNLNSVEGKIDFTTGDSLGEIVTLVFPIGKDIEKDDGDLPLDEKSSNGKVINVLIVEDDKYNSMILKMFIEHTAEVSCAFSGNEAINIIEIFYNKGIIFDIVFMDIGLPKPWDGIILKKEIEKKWHEYSNVPFVAQTAFATEHYAKRINEANFKGYLVKPINKNDILKFISKIPKIKAL